MYINTLTYVVIHMIACTDMDIRFALGNSLIICGPSQAGKTVWVSRLLQHRDLLFKEKINKIYWFYGTWQKSYEDLKTRIPEIKFCDEIPTESLENSLETKSIVVLDDLVKETENSANVTSFYKTCSPSRIVSRLHNSKFFPPIARSKNATFKFALHCFSKILEIKRNLQFWQDKCSPVDHHENLQSCLRKLPRDHTVICLLICVKKRQVKYALGQTSFPKSTHQLCINKETARGVGC